MVAFGRGGVFKEREMMLEWGIRMMEERFSVPI